MIYRSYLFMINHANVWQDYDYAVAESVEQARSAVIQSLQKSYVPSVAAEIIGYLDGCDVYEIPPVMQLNFETYKASTRLLAHSNVWWDEIQISVMREFIDWATGLELGELAVRGIVYVMQQGVDLGLPLVVRGLNNPA